MLVTSLRSILRRSSVLPTKIHIRRNQSSIEAEFDGLLNMMHEVGELSSPRSTFAESNSGSYGTYKDRIHGFLRNRPLMPDAFTREKRVEKKRLAPKKWILGPPTKKALFTDIFRQLEIDPVKECMNPRLLSAYVTQLGRVKRRAETGLTTRSQRKVAKAIKRAKMMGIMPTHSRHWHGLYKFPK